MFGEIDGWRQILVVTDNGERTGSAPDRTPNQWLTNDLISAGECDNYWSMTAAEFLANAIPPE
jgi:hypothetical protein